MYKPNPLTVMAIGAPYAEVTGISAESQLT